MIRFWYSLFFYLVSPIIWIYLLIRAIKAPEYREGFRQRLGFVPQKARKGGIVIHCASVGETIAAVPLIEKLISTYPEKVITITSSTPTGKQTVADRFGEKVQSLYLPGDWIGAVNRFFNRVQPELMILMETELWFNLLHACQKRNIPVLLANARLSEKSLKQYLKFPRFSQQLFNMVDCIAAQYAIDESNFKTIGVTDKKLQLVGSIKFDVSIPDALKEQQSNLRKDWAQGRPVWIAASIHPGEFDTLLSVFKNLLKKIPELLLIAVPRHPEQFENFKTQCRQAELSFVNRSENQSPDESTQVVVGDTMGEMLLFCGVADIAYVGGSLIKRGGHNPLEPIVCGVPVLMGPHIYNFNDIGEKLVEAGLLDLVEDGSELEKQVASRLSDKTALEKQSEACVSFMKSNRGTLERLMSNVSELLIQK